MGEVDTFTAYRPLLFTIAYEILGTASDADDVLQETYLRWSRVDETTVAQPRAYLARIVARQALNHLRVVGRRRESYVGNWLPEPIQTPAGLAADETLADAVSLAMLVVLESLGPDERCVFVLHEVFAFPFRDIAAMVGKSEAATRQIAHRARTHVRERHQRFDAKPAKAEEVVLRFLRAARDGDFQGLMDVLAPEVVQMSDGGGMRSAARRPVHGAEPVARLSLGVARREPDHLRAELTSCNGMPTAVFRDGDAVYQALLFDVVARRIRGLYAVRNPDKLRRFDHPRRLTR